jgi:CRISPR/Cas system-associated exonuclease Cas4 (RecB family)
LAHYIPAWSKDFKATLIEPELKIGNVVGHPDLLGWYRDSWVVVEFKTTKLPDQRSYDLSGQADLYAFILEEMHDAVEFIIYDVISEKGIYRHTRPPNLERGLHLWRKINSLDEKQDGLLRRPHYKWDCSSCDYFIPCWLMETGGDWWDYLDRNYVRKEYHAKENDNQ